MSADRSREGRSLSIVIPAYNEANRIGPSLRKIEAYVKGHPDFCEVIVVDDGSQDGTAQVIQSLAEAHPWVRLLRNPINTGKGAAVKLGVLSAHGGEIAFCDADLSVPIEELDQLLACLDGGYDIAIGSRVRTTPDKRVQRRVLRRLMASAFNLLVRALLVHRIVDTQCGLKAFKTAVALDLFSQQSISGFAFDVELLWRAQRSGYRIAEVPISWIEDAESRIRPWRDSWIMARDVVGLWWRERVIPACRRLGARVAQRQP
ncbi:MAG: glycosyltransferase family 2 protein [candidate division NC10 bacterium]|nr:glycosyltransferase family 2 protein [candidate division NC10 bacterium]